MNSRINFWYYDASIRPCHPMLCAQDAYGKEWSMPDGTSQNHAEAVPVVLEAVRQLSAQI